MAAKVNQAEEIDKYKRFMRRSKKDPIYYVKHMFGATPTDHQGQLLEALPHHRSIRVRSGHGTGKTCSMAWSIMWFLDCWRNSQVPCTANSGDQLRNVLWKELAKWEYERKIAVTRGLYKLTTERYFRVTHPNTWFAVAVKWDKSNPNAFAGFHAEHILRIGEEAFGIPDVIFETAEGSQTEKNARSIYCGNPTVNSGYMYEEFHANSAYNHCLHFSSAVSDRVSDEYVQDIINKYGIDSNVYKVRVEGEFPDQEDDKIYSITSIENAVNAFTPSRILKVGVDPARMGKDTSEIVTNYGNCFTRFKTLNKCDGPILGDAVIEVIEKEIAERGVEFVLGGPTRNESPGKEVPIFLDEIGVGASPYDYLRGKGYNVQGVNVARSPRDKKKYINLKHELYFDFAEKLKAGEISFNFSKEKFKLLRKEMLGIPYYIYGGSGEHNGKLAVPSKEELNTPKYGNLESPNKLEAMLMTLVEPRRSVRKLVERAARNA